MFGITVCRVQKHVPSSLPTRLYKNLSMSVIDQVTNKNNVNQLYCTTIIVMTTGQKYRHLSDNIHNLDADYEFVKDKISKYLNRQLKCTVNETQSAPIA